jgi:hypothetical protein
MCEFQRDRTRTLGELRPVAFAEVIDVKDVDGGELLEPRVELIHVRKVLHFPLKAGGGVEYSVSNGHLTRGGLRKPPSPASMARRIID